MKTTFVFPVRIINAKVLKFSALFSLRNSSSYIIDIQVFIMSRVQPNICSDSKVVAIIIYSRY